MLRSKHLGTLSQSTRSFFLSGSRNSAADGSSCTCSEDEACTSRRPHGANVRQAQKSSSLLLKASAGVGSLTLHDSGNEVNAKKIENGTLPPGISMPQPLKGTNASSYTDDFYAKDAVHHLPPTAPTADKLASMAAVGLLPDLVTYGIPVAEGSAVHTTSPSFMIDRTNLNSNATSDNVKASKKDKACARTSGESVSCSNSTYAYSGSKGRVDKPVSAKEVANLSNDVPQSSGLGISLEPRYRKRPVPQRSRAPTVARLSSTSSPAAGRISCILRQFKWSPAAEDALGKLDCVPDAYQANQILKQLQDYKVAVGFFDWLKRQPEFKHDGHTYTTMVGILGRARQFGAIDKLLDQMVADGCEPNIVTYNRLIHSYGKANYLSDALGVFNQMQRIGCEPDRVTYCTLIDIHAKAGYLDVAIDMYQRMQQAGLSPDTFTYSVIINCLGKAGHLAVAHKLFGEMVNQGCVPSIVTYNIMIALHAKARNYQTSLQLYRDMQKTGFKPDKVTYSIVMEVLGHFGYLDESEAVFVEMKRKNMVPDEPVYGLLVDLWGKAGNVEKAWDWFQTMLGAGLRPNVPTCNSLLSTFLKAHRLCDAYDLLQNMLGLGLNPSLQTYTLLLSCCTEAQTSSDMAFCGRLMSTTGHPAHSFLLSMPAPGPDGQNVRNHVSNFLDVMHSEDRESKRGLVDAVIDFFHKTGLKEEAGSIWEVAAQKNVYPDALRRKSPCYWLINLHVMSDGTAVTALSRTLAWFHREMIASGICPTRIDIVTGWGRRSRVTGASLVRQAVEEVLTMFRSPFYTENGNSGCFVGFGEPLSRWLLQPFVERMHLL